MFLGSLRRGGAAEATLAARALGLHVVTLGASDESESIFKDALPVLEPVILTSKSAATRAAVAEALATLCFVGAEGPHETLECMSVLAKAFKGEGEMGGAACGDVAVEPGAGGWDAFRLTLRHPGRAASRACRAAAPGSCGGHPRLDAPTVDGACI